MSFAVIRISTGGKHSNRACRLPASPARHTHISLENMRNQYACAAALVSSTGTLNRSSNRKSVGNSWIHGLLTMLQRPSMKNKLTLRNTGRDRKASSNLSWLLVPRAVCTCIETFGEAAMAGQNWRWRQRVSGTGVGQLKRIDVAVFEPALSTQSASSTLLEGASPLVTLSALVRPARRNAR